MNPSTQWNELIGVAFRPLQRFLEAPDVVEICVNEPGVVYLERAGDASMTRYEVPDLTDQWIRFMAERIAAASHQFVNEQEPLLSASMPDGKRIQAVLPPAAPDGGALVIRSQVSRNLSLADYAARGALAAAVIARPLTAVSQAEDELCKLLALGNIERFLRAAVESRVSILVSGGTGSGKTTFLNALMQEIPDGERIITIEDTPEVRPRQQNHLRLIVTRGDQNIARIDARKLVAASLRMRPDRLLLGEIRGEEAFDFLQAINTGHPGSLSTVHANTTQGAYMRLAMLVMQSPAVTGMSKGDLIDFLKMTLPLVVQIGRHDGMPGNVTGIYYEPFARSSLAHLVKSPRTDTNSRASNGNMIP